MATTHGALVIKLLETVGLFVAVLLASAAIRITAKAVLHGKSRDRVRFWTAQTVHILTAVALIGGVIIIWLRNTPQLGAIGGWVAAGLAISLQRVVTAFAGYLIVLRGKVFTVGDRITIGNVRGDVVALGFMQTTVMEMGQSHAESSDSPAMWVKGRQYSGRIVRVTNDKIFDTPVYNYTRDFPFLWDEIVIPIAYRDDYRVIERLLLDVTRTHTAGISAAGSEALDALEGAYFLSGRPSVDPRVFVRLTDNWIELSVRFLARDHDIRALKDAMFRDILAGMKAANIGVASGTYAIVEMPTVTVDLASHDHETPPRS